MTKRMMILLAWSSQAGKYEVQTDGETVSRPITLEGQSWSAWLDTVPSFSFHSKSGHTCTIRKERVQRGNTYWYGYRRKSEKIVKRYLGRSANLTIARLENIAAQLDGASSSPAHKSPVSLEGIEPSTSIHFNVQTETQVSSPFPNEVDASRLNSPSGSLVRPAHHLLLASKFHVPRLGSHLVERLHLIGRLNFRKEHVLSLISAPAGSGKTTLLAQWRAQSRIPVAWLSLGPEENDSIRFFTYVIAALQKLDARLGGNALSLMGTPGFSQLETALTLLMNDVINCLTGDVVLILDDYHVVSALPIHQMMIFLLEHMPPQLHLFLATRTDPPFPLSLLRARGQLTEIRAAELRFDTAEIGVFMHEVMGLHFSGGDLSLLENRTEGWITGLQLAGLSLQNHPHRAQFLDTFTGSHHFILDYLGDEIFSQQRESVQTFLLYTSLLDRLCGPLCDTLMDRRDGQAMLEYLSQANLFLIPLDENRHWYRYHQLFRDYLRHHLEETHSDSIPLLYQRASLWCEQNNLMTEAVDYALATSNVEYAARLIAQIGSTYEINGEVTILSHWLDQLPDHLIRSHTGLCLLRCWSLAMKGQLPVAESWLHHAKGTLFSSDFSQISKRDDLPSSVHQASVLDEKEQLGSFFMLDAYIAIAQGNIPRCVESASQALAHIPEQQVYTRSFVTLHKGFAYALQGNLLAAAQTYKEAGRLGHTIENTYIMLTSLCSEATIQGKLGQFHAAEETYQQALRLSRKDSQHPYPYASMAHIGLAGILYEWNDLSAETMHLLEGMTLSEQWGNRDYIIYGSLLLAVVKQVQGDHVGAGRLMDLANEHLSTCQLPIWGASFAATYQTRLLLMQGNVEGAVHWANNHVLGDFEHLTQVRILLAQEQWKKALEIVEQQLPLVEAAMLTHMVVEFLMLQALAYYQGSDIVQSLLALERALFLAQTEGYTRLFVDAGEPMAALLFKVFERQQRRRTSSPSPVSSNYISKLLSLLGKDEGDVNSLPQEKSPIAFSDVFIKALSEREIEIIHCVVSGMSNDQVAQHLVVAKSTVQWHLKNIYSKLGIHTRAQLVLRARELGL